MEDKITITKLTCKRCGHIWPPKQENVHVCPKCKTPYWNVDKHNPAK